MCDPPRVKSTRELDELADELYDHVYGPTWNPNLPPKYTYAELRERGTWWQRMRKRLSRAA